MIHTLSESVPHQRIPNRIESHLMFGVLKISTKVYFPSVASSCGDSSSVWQKEEKADESLHYSHCHIRQWNILNAPQAWCLPCVPLCCSSLHISWCTDGLLPPSHWLRATVQTLAATWCKKERSQTQWNLAVLIDDSCDCKVKVYYRHAMTDSSSGEVTARISILHSLTL